MSKTTKPSKPLVPTSNHVSHFDAAKSHHRERGQEWAEAMPYCRHGPSGYQIRWNPAVVDVVRELG